MTVLVADDSRLMRSVIKHHFKELDMGHCSFVEAEDGEEAFRLVQTRHIDLVFLDWNMPKMSGIEFLKQIRAIESFKYLPIIMVTSDTIKEHIIEALRHGVTDYILKPIDQKIFGMKVYRRLKAAS